MTSPPAPPLGGEGGGDFAPALVQVASIQELFPEITCIRTDLLTQGISLVIIAIRKSKNYHVRLIASDLLVKSMVPNVKFLLFVDDLLDLSSLSQVAWISANNIDPIRDCFHIDREAGVKYPTLCIDATRKRKDFDDFQREWPNVTVMDDRTINTVDEKWPRLKIGPRISSPSLIYKALNVNTGAVSKENF